MIGIGTKLQIESETEGTFIDVVGLDTLNPSLGELGMIDVTDFDTPDNGEANDPGLIKWGTVSFEGNYSGDASQLALSNALYARTSKNFKINFPTAVQAGGKSVALSGYVTKFAITAPAKDKLRFSGEITINSKPVLS